MQHRALIMIVIVSLVLGASTLTRGHEWGDDFASYIMQAESILSGKTQEFVEHNAITIFQSSIQIGPVAYPWGYPLLLAPVYALKGNNPLALKLPGLFFYVGFLNCLYLLMKTRLTQTDSLLVAGLFAFNPMLIKFLDFIVSDIPFLFFSTLALLLMVSNGTRRTLFSVALGFAIASAFFIRTTGILLLFSYFSVEIFHAWNKRTAQGTVRSLIRNLLILGGTFALLWLLYALAFPGGGESYFAQYQDFQLRTALGFISSYFMVFSRFFGEHFLWTIVYLVLFVFFLLGAWERRREDLVLILFFSLWMLALITWPFWQGPRFIFPVLPVFIYFTFQGIHVLLEKLPERHVRTGRWLVYGFWSLVLLSFLFTSSRNAYINLRDGRVINGPYDPYSREGYKYIQEKTPPDSVVVFFKPRAMRLMTGHDSIMSMECERILQGDYLVLSRKVGNNQQIPPDEIGNCNLPLVKIFTNARFIIYELQK